MAGSKLPDRCLLYTSIGCFSPVTYLSRRDLTLIRPMLLATEQEVISAVNAEGLPIVKSVCPSDGVTVREQTKELSLIHILSSVIWHTFRMELS